MIKKILNSTGLRQSLILTGGNFGATLFSAAALILISRRLGPSLFGEFTVGYSLMIILVRLQGLGLNVAIQKLAGRYFNENNWQARLSRLLQVSSTFNVGLIGVGLVIGVALSWPISQLLHINSSAIIFGSFLFASVTLFFEYLTTVLQVIHRFSESVYMMLVQSILKLGVALTVFFLKLESVAVVFYSFYFTPIFGIVLGWLTLPKSIKLFPLRRDPELEQSLIKVMLTGKISISDENFSARS